MINNVLAKIAEIPPLPQSVIDIEAMIHDEGKSFADYKKVIEKDAVITAEILRSVNSPLYGFNREITSLQQAISLFGIGSIRGFILGSVSKKSFLFDLSAYAMSEKDFEKRSLVRSALMLKWIMKKFPSRLLQLGPAAFMIDLGQILIAQEIKQKGQDKAFMALISEGMSTEEAEKKICGVTTAEVTTAIFDHWGFELDLIHILRYCEHPDATHGLTQELSAYLKAVRACVGPKGDITEVSTQSAVKVIETFKLDKKFFLSALQSITNEQTLS
jgi:HD-like signal output (HDOD) protein